LYSTQNRIRNGYEHSYDFSNYSKQNQNTRKHGKYESARNLQHTYKWYMENMYI
jgi:hypothetical protein